MRRYVTLSDLIGMTFISTLLFVVYPNLLWQAPVGASHMERFLISYAAVVPLAVAVAWIRTRRITFSEVGVAVFLVWSVKMLLTVGLYHFMVQGTAPHLEPQRNQASAKAPISTRYVGVAGFTGRTVRGRVTDSQGNPVPDALVAMPTLDRGKASLGRAVDTKLELRDAFVRPRLSVVPLGGRLVFLNHEEQTVVVRGSQAGRSVFNVPALADVPVTTGKQLHVGLVALESSTAEKRAAAWSYVAGNPYTARTDASGSFQLDDVPPGAQELSVYASTEKGLLEGRARTADEDVAELTVELRPSSLERAAQR